MINAVIQFRRNNSPSGTLAINAVGAMHEQNSSTFVDARYATLSVDPPWDPNWDNNWMLIHGPPGPGGNFPGFMIRDAGTAPANRPRMLTVDSDTAPTRVGVQGDLGPGNRVWSVESKGVFMGNFHRVYLSTVVGAERYYICAANLVDQQVLTLSTDLSQRTFFDLTPVPGLGDPPANYGSLQPDPGAPTVLVALDAALERAIQSPTGPNGDEWNRGLTPALIYLRFLYAHLAPQADWASALGYFYTNLYLPTLGPSPTKSWGEGPPPTILPPNPPEYPPN